MTLVTLRASSLLEVALSTGRRGALILPIDVSVVAGRDSLTARRFRQSHRVIPRPASLLRGDDLPLTEDETAALRERWRVPAGADPRRYSIRSPWESQCSLTIFDGCTRGGSPSIFGKFGGYGASPRPCWSSSRSDQSSSSEMSKTASSIPACRSPSSANRAGMV